MCQQNAQLDEALEAWTEAVQVLQKLYHNEQVFLLKYRLLRSQIGAREDRKEGVSEGGVSGGRQDRIGSLRGAHSQPLEEIDS